MALDVRFGATRFSSPTSIDASFEIPHTLGATPKAALFVATTHITATGTADEASFQIGIGATDGTRQFCMTTFSEDALASTNCVSVSRDDSLITVHNLLVASFVSWDASQVVVNMSFVTASARDVVMYVWGGADVSAYVDDIAVASGDNVITAPNFEPQAVLCFSTDQLFNETGGNFLALNVGCAVNDGVPTNKSNNYIELDNASAGNPVTYSATAKVRVEQFGATEQSAITDFGSQGFTLNSDSAADTPLGYLALSFGGAAVKLYNFTTPTSAPFVQAHTTPNHRPVGVLMCMSSAAALDTQETDADAGGFGFGGFAVNGEQGSISGAIEDAADPTDTQSNCQAVALMCGVADNAAAIKATGVSMDVQGFTLNYSATNTTARHGWVLSFGDAINPPPEWNPKHPEKPGKGNPNPPGKDKPNQRRDFLWREYGEVPGISSAIFASGATPPFIFPAQSADEVRRPQGPYFPIAQFFTAPNYKKERRRRVEDVEDDLRETFRRATEADSPSEQREAIREVKRAAATALSIAKRDEDLELMELAQSIIDMRKLRDMQEYLRKVGEVLSREQREQDDLDAFMMIASLS